MNQANSNCYAAAIVAWTAVLAVVVPTPAAEPALPGRHRLTEAQAGAVLIADLRCAACHEGVPNQAWPEKTAPDLSHVGGRVAPEYLERFLASPATAHPGTTMPDVLHSLQDAERPQAAKALAHFLIAQSRTPLATQPLATQPPTSADRERGKTLFHSVGCVACHGPRADADPAVARTPNATDDAEDDPDAAPTADKLVAPIAVPLNHVAAKYTRASLSDFLFQPLQVRSGGRMPDMKLTPDESQALASYLIGEGAPSHVAWTADESLAAAGKRYFEQLNCAACHLLPGFAAAPKRNAFDNADLKRGCLSSDSRNSPRYTLTSSQIAAIIAAVGKRDVEEAAATTVAKTLTAFRCIACHVRDDYGGVHESINGFFTGSEQKLGDDGRIPPPLTLVGAKLQPVWLKKVLFDGDAVRTYMTTRMPQYGAANLSHLPPLFAQLDVLPAAAGTTALPALQIPNPESRSEAERERAKLLRTAGAQLLGDRGLNCIACHNFNGKSASGNQGIDLTASYPRLQSAWFNQYVRNPGAFRPRTVMPTAWPDGMALHKTILDGDAEQQITAVWFYMSLGTSAADPPGVRGINTKLAVGDEANLHRGRSRVAGYRGIAVGLPERLSYAFNAETGTLSAIWTGDFVNVNWSGQGSGDFQPAADAILLPQDVSFAQLDDEQAPWPRMPVTSKEMRTNPDPLYPKNHGYQFRGYGLDDLAIPTFRYRCHQIQIDDRSTAATIDEQLWLKRVFTFTTPTPQTVWFRALVGELQQESEHVYRAARLRVKLPPTEVVRRPLEGDPNRSELLLKLTLPQGQSSLEIRYEPLPK